jgi:hypothetical protein
LIEISSNKKQLIYIIYYPSIIKKEDCITGAMSGLNDDDFGLASSMSTSASASQSSTTTKLFPAIERAMKILSTRLGVDTDITATKVEMEKEFHEHEDDDIKVDIEDVTAAGRDDGSLTYESEEIMAPNEDLSSDSLEGTSIPTNDDSVSPTRPHKAHKLEELRLSGLSALAHDHQRSQQHAAKRIDEVALSRKARVLQKALDWCARWQLQRRVFNRFMHFVSCRLALRTIFSNAMSRVYSKTTFELHFSINMKTNCRNRFGKIRVSELYNKWRVKRKCLKQWLSYISS